VSVGGGVLVVGALVGGALVGEVPVDGVPRLGALGVVLGVVLGWVDALGDGVVVLADGVRDVAGWEGVCDGVVGFARLVVPERVGLVVDAVLVAAGFDSGVAEVVPCWGPTSVVGGNLVSLPLSKTPATTAPAVATRAIPPTSTVFLLIRFGGSTGSSGLVAILGVSGMGTTTGPRSAPSGSARKAPAAISAADGRSAASLASIWSRTVSNGPRSSGRVRLGGAGGVSTCW
jgi:hypothetical protein